MDLADRHLIRYVPGFAPFIVNRAEGSWVWDRDGNRILDFTSGQICSTIGHNHPRIVEAGPRAIGWSLTAQLART
jgi:Ornithine/acetylornithine aminotransferase